LPSLVWERIGKKNIINLLNFTSPAELVTVFTPTAAELEWGQENLEPHGVALYDDYEQMLSLTREYKPSLLRRQLWCTPRRSFWQSTTICMYHPIRAGKALAEGHVRLFATF
jgi:hypothetical protein